MGQYGICNILNFFLEVPAVKSCIVTSGLWTCSLRLAVSSVRYRRFSGISIRPSNAAAKLWTSARPAWPNWTSSSLRRAPPLTPRSGITHASQMSSSCPPHVLLWAEVHLILRDTGVCVRWTFKADDTRGNFLSNIAGQLWLMLASTSN